MADQEARDPASEFIVPPELDGTRLDKALALLMGVSRGVSSGLVERGVTINGVHARSSDRVTQGSILSSPQPYSPVEARAEPVEFEVLYEDTEVIVVDKPAGVVVHPGAGRVGGTLAAGLLYRFPELESVGDPGRWGLVHRLDKDTSGVLIVARTVRSLEILQQRLKRREIKRVYTALAHGIFEAATGTIDAPIGRDPARPMLRAVSRDGKPARTHYQVLESFASQDCTLLEVNLETGRTHQIRVHLDAVGHPVVGDPVYGFRPRRFTSPRIFLHAAQVTFAHPRTEVPTTVSSPLPDDLRGVLGDLVPP